MTGPQIHTAEYHATVIPSGEQYASRFASLPPHRPQWRKQLQICLILNQQDATLWHPPQSAQNFAFFSLDPDPEPVRSAAASTRNSIAAAHDALWWPNI